MKCAIVIAHGVKQIMLSAENEEEKTALALITTNDDITLDIKEGKFYDGRIPESAHAFRVESCQGGWFRAFEDSSSVMLVLRPKQPSDKRQSDPERWKVDAYAKLGQVRDQMPPEHVGIIQVFIGPLPDHLNDRSQPPPPISK